jgi:hypothetical protein
MPRFVILLHECPGDRPRATHCDLMLEVGSALETWALRQVPQGWCELDLSQDLFARSNSVKAQRIADHRLAYLDYEGPVSGDRGSVRRLDAGQYRVGPTANGRVLDGQFVRGEIEVVPRPGAGATYQLTFRASERLTDS